MLSNSCAYTKWLPQNQEVWWQVDLLMYSEIKDVTIYYRNDTGSETRLLDGFKIYISNGPSNWRNKEPCFKDTTPGYPSSILNVTCVGYGRYVTVYNDHYHEADGAILELCEVQVFGCKSGTYGWECRKSCPLTCQENRCDPYMAHCLKACADNYFGLNCEKFCHCKNDGCNPENGHCFVPGCKAGYKGVNCTTACGGNVFCNSSCNCETGGCDIVTGMCVVPGCRAGWKGKGCNERMEF
ncbi:hypothetical protein KUTeg_016266 [Tegillarca granosa]|uniref:F5/8 type C domain-containing protein n=1 Tax=Tegillarca granosa TaxID=220873 RepID=A0ABQ9EKD3_TEGGR|nr:hypothetical protein KUTeg_016266 [Tegillarca granosa]